MYWYESSPTNNCHVTFLQGDGMRSYSRLPIVSLIYHLTHGQCSLAGRSQNCLNNAATLKNSDPSKIARCCFGYDEDRPKFQNRGNPASWWHSKIKHQDLHMPGTCSLPVI